jgi:Zn-dependent M28 family amino/carboxypeptidase
MFTHMLKIGIVFLILIFDQSCNGLVRNTVKTDVVTEVTVAASSFDADSAYHFVKTQADFSPRVPNTPAHQKCAIWIESSLKRYSQNVVVQSFQAKAYNGTTLNLRNLIASFNPTNPRRVLLCAHWDSRPFADHDPDPANREKPVPGVNDGASGVGVLLEIARQFSIKAPAVGVDILLLDGEDYGAPENANSNMTDDWALGSQYWSSNPHVQGYTARYGILLDMVGAAGATFTKEGTSQMYAPDIMRKVWRIASKLGYDSYFVNDETGSLTDDHVYINKKLQIPTIDIIQNDPMTGSGFYKNWHTTHDDLNGIDKQTLKAVGQTVISVVYNEK